MGSAMRARPRGGGQGGGGTCAGDVVNARTEVLDDGASATLHCQDAGQLADDVLGCSPVGHLACQLHADHLGTTPADTQAPARPSGHVLFEQPAEDSSFV